MNLPGRERQLETLRVHPVWTIRLQNAACQRRHFALLDQLDRRFEKIASRLDTDRAHLSRRRHEPDDTKRLRGFPQLKISSGKEDREGSEMQPTNEFGASLFTKLPLLDAATSKASEAAREESRKCLFGRVCQSCPYFPCRRPLTYHSLGFRPDNCSTSEWITWADLKKRHQL